MGLFARQPARTQYVDITLNGQPRPVGDRIAIAELLEELGFAGKIVAVEVNLQLVPVEQRGEHRLADGDRVEIVTLVGGG